MRAWNAWIGRQRTGDVRIRIVKSGVCREDHISKGVKRCTMVLGGVRWSLVAVDTFGWVGLDSLMETEDGENRRQRRRSARADAVRILWRGNMWRMPKGCAASTWRWREVDLRSVHMSAWSQRGADGWYIHGVMLKVELESDGKFCSGWWEGYGVNAWRVETYQQEGERHLIWAGAHGSERGVELGISRDLTDGSAMVPEVVWVSYPVDLGQDCGCSAQW
jgi:hypothetical protein